MHATDPRGDVGLRLAGAAAAWLGGVALQLGQPALWTLAAYAGVAAVGAFLLLAATAVAPRRLAVRATLALPGLLLIAYALAGARAVERLAPTLPAELEGRDIVVTGVVASLPQVGPSGVRFLFDVETVPAAAGVPPRLALGWYRPWHDDGGAFAPADELRAGDRWRFTVRLRRPHGHVNPHGHDHELWLFERGVRATGHVRAVRGSMPPQRLASAVGHPVERLRQRVRDAIEAHVTDPRAAGVLAALAVGDQGAIDVIGQLSRSLAV